MLQRVQPALIGPIDGTVSTLAPIFATAFLAGTARGALRRARGGARRRHQHGALGGALRRRSDHRPRHLALARPDHRQRDVLRRRLHALPFLISDLQTALLVASLTVGCELMAIAWIRKRFLNVSLRSSLIQVTIGGVIVAVTGALIGQA